MSDEPIDQANRFTVVAAALIVIFAALLVTMLAWLAPGGTIDHVADLAGWLRRHDDRETKIIISLVAAVVTLLMLMAIIIELTPSPTQKMRVRDMKSGEARITTQQIAERVDAEVHQIQHIAQCRATVVARGKKVEVILDLHVGPGADLSQTADEACRRADVLITQQLGIALAARPRARLHYRELRLRTGAASNTGPVSNAEAAPSVEAGPRAETAPSTETVQSTSSEWARPGTTEETRDQRRNTDASEEAQAAADRTAGA